MHQRKVTSKAGGSEKGGEASPSSDKGGKEDIIQGVGKKGCALPSPSGVNTLPLFTQAVVAVSCAIGMGLLTAGFSSLVTSMKGVYLFDLWMSTWPLLGLFYALVGVLHFVLLDDQCNIVPPNGTWGFWYLPGGAEFHVQWTGIVEIVFGLSVVLGKAIETLPSFSAAGLHSDAAFVCFLLTVAVTPANIYMFTHGARFPKKAAVMSIAAHVIRGLVQVYFLSAMLQMAQPTIDVLRGEALMSETSMETDV